MLLIVRPIILVTLLCLTFSPGVSAADLLFAAVVFYGLDFLLRRWLQANKRKEEAAHIRLVLQLHPTPYYKALNQQQQLEFEDRLVRFIQLKQFVPRGKGMEVTTEMKVKIAACAVQLTLGLREIHFAHFKTFIIYPDRYYSTIYKQYHCGEVNMRGLIVLSWRDFEIGNYNPKDGLNLGLHEMAHALHLENSIRNQEYDFLNRAYLQHWTVLSESERQRMQLEKSIFRRLCTAPDEHEFFAVAVELFFELPQLLKQEHPEIYSSLARLLNQDPAAKVTHQIIQTA
ncbi:zinc-dependent peptidase [Pontibacter burrus]|uniref:zinc-dependent peptidase n=1 Tax=Pontibacter burrus TaxID=2704466 RepID=UPI00293BCC7E|nr:zinc-dependent peptidase [Pontibacter burrus]